MKNRTIVIRGGSDSVRAVAAKRLPTDRLSFPPVRRSVDRKKLSRVRALADAPRDRNEGIEVQTNNTGAIRAERVIEAGRQVTGFKPEEIERARGYAEQACRFDKVIASYGVRDSGAAFAQLSWGEYSIEQIEIVLADLKRIERALCEEGEV